MPLARSSSVRGARSQHMRACSADAGAAGAGAVAREKELLKQIECLTKEMTEARNETDKFKGLATKAEAAKEKLQGKLVEERSEADAIQKKLIRELRDAKAKLAEAEDASALLKVPSCPAMCKRDKVQGGCAYVAAAAGVPCCCRVAAAATPLLLCCWRAAAAAVLLPCCRAVLLPCCRAVLLPCCRARCWCHVPSQS